MSRIKPRRIDPGGEPDGRILAVSGGFAAWVDPEAVGGGLEWVVVGATPPADPFVGQIFVDTTRVGIDADGLPL